MFFCRLGRSARSCSSTVLLPLVFVAGEAVGMGRRQRMARTAMLLYLSWYVPEPNSNHVEGEPPEIAAPVAYSWDAPL